MADKVDSNATGLAFAEEVSLKTLPANPVFYGLEPNSYSDFGGELGTTARNPINQSRQRRKGGTTDIDASGGINHDLTHGLKRIMQGFLFADAHVKPSNRSLLAAAVAITAVDDAADTYALVDGDDLFQVGHLLLASRFGIAANNGLKVVTAATASLITVSQALVDEAAPPATAELRAVGFEFAAGDLSLSAAIAGVVSVTTVAKDFLTMALNVGEWVFVGGGTVGTNFVDNAPFYARISAISAKTLTFDKTTIANPVDDAGATKTIRLFFGDFIRNEKNPDLIKRRTYHLQRSLGRDANGVQSEVIAGSVPNEITVNIPTPGPDSKVNLDMSFVGMDYDTRTGLEGLLSATAGGTLVDPASEDFFNTSSHIYRSRIAAIDPTSSNPAALIGYVSEATLTINNNVEPNKAIGTFGAFDASVGTFEVGGSFDAYFGTVVAVAAIRNNADVTYDLILAKQNAAMVFDLPLIALGSGRLEVEQDEPITLPIEQMAAEGAMGFTLGLTFFNYVPSVAVAA
jgi:hypothetical protein